MSWKEECKQLISENQLLTALQYMEDKGVDVTELRKEYVEVERLLNIQKPLTTAQHENYLLAHEKLITNLLKAL